MPGLGRAGLHEGCVHFAGCNFDVVHGVEEAEDDGVQVLS